MNQKSIIAALGLVLVAVITTLFLQHRQPSGPDSIAGVVRVSMGHEPVTIKHRLEEAELAARVIFRINGDMEFKGAPRNRFKVGDSDLEWSVMDQRTKTGWLYFDRPSTNDELWEFAPCSHLDLEGVGETHSNMEFVREGDGSKIQNLFNASNWVHPAIQMNGRAIPVREGQVVFARRLDAPQRVYAIKLINQRGTIGRETIDFEYLEIESPDQAAH
jgi:hypothetical protein